MVKDYQTALEIAKSNGLTCITPQLQVVYAGAFITKVGKPAELNASANCSMTLYNKIREIEQSFAEK